jgi:hypothetical protein
VVPLKNVTDPVVTGLPDEVTDAVRVTVPPALIVELESESEVVVAAWLGGGADELLPQAAIEASAGTRATANER